KNQEKIQRLLQGFIPAGETLIAIQEQSLKKEAATESKVYILTDKKIIYMEISKIDIFLKCYPLNNLINYQVERDLTQGTDPLDPSNIMKIKITLGNNSSIIFRFDKDRDEKNYFTSLTGEKMAALNFVTKLNHLLSRQN
ncbi:MAG: hypothetical protein ACQEP2_07995, partial [Actinomycetota bacterium]